MLKYQFDHSRDHYYGHPIAPLELIQYGDFQCEYSAAAYQEIKKLQEKLGHRLRFVFRHYPVTNIHPVALDAAIATEAAAAQGKFWEMHDIIFENQKNLTRASLVKFAEEIELDTKLFEDSRHYKKLLQKVLSDYESGVKSGVKGTPAFFINGHQYNGFDDFGNLYKTCNYVLSFKGMAA